MKKSILVLLLLFGVAVSAQDKYTPELLWKLGRVSSPQVSPDGKEVIYTIRRYKLELNKGNTDIYKVSVSGGSAIQLTSDSTNETSPHWSSDGKKIFFLSDKGGSSQLWSMNPDGSNQTKESNLDYDINDYGISGNGSMIWFTKDVKEDKTAKDIYPDLQKSSARLYDDLMYRHWDTWYDGTFSHVHVAKFDNGKIGDPKDIMKGEKFDSPVKPNGGAEEIAWSPDGKKVAYTSQKLFGKEYAVSTNSDIYIYDVTTGTTTDLTEGMNGYDKVPLFSPDGNKLIWKSQETPGHEADRQRLFIYDFNTKEKKELTTSFDYNVETASFNASGNTIYFIGGIKATENVFGCDLTTGKIRQITNDVANHSEMSVSGDVVVTSRVSMTDPAELYLIDVKNGTSKKITSTNKDVLSGIKSCKVEKRMIKATDGKEILTWVIYPPDFDASKKYPTLLYCQGGPQSTVSQFFSYRWNFQMMAANGYIVVAPNRRGLPSFGEEWNDEISGDWGGQAMKDLLSAIDSVSKEPFVNKDKMGCVGASFGGFTVYWMEGHHNKRFKAFISHDGVFNLESMYGSTEELWFVNHDLTGPYWQKPQSYVRFSPHRFVRSWDTPILIITNEKDFRVPLEQGLEAYTAARQKGLEARLLVFPDENHWVSKPQNSVLWQRVFFDWLDRYLK